MKKKININFHAIFGIAVGIIVAVCIIRVFQWTHKSLEVDLDVEEGSFDMECNDFYVYPPSDYEDDHVDDGVNDILIIGDYLVNNYGEKHSIINKLKDGLDANIIDLTAEKVRMTSEKPKCTPGIDAFTLAFLVKSISDGDFSNQMQTADSETFNSKKRYNDYMERLLALDMNDIDTVIIMYSFHDYFATIAQNMPDEHDTRGYHGTLLTAVETLQQKWPHLQIIISSSVPEYFTDENGNIVLGSQHSFGQGTESIYYNHQYAIATQCCVSFIDNYFYKINETNITEYSDGLNLNDKGIDLIAQHIIDFINNKGM